MAAGSRLTRVGRRPLLKGSHGCPCANERGSVGSRDWMLYWSQADWTRAICSRMEFNLCVHVQRPPRLLPYRRWLVAGPMFRVQAHRMTRARGALLSTLALRNSSGTGSAFPRGHDDDTLGAHILRTVTTHVSRAEAAVKGSSRGPGRRLCANDRGSLRPGATGTPSFTRACRYPWGADHRVHLPSACASAGGCTTTSPTS